jgi:hypothetical protein
MDLERGPLSLVRITEELLEWKSSSSRSRKPRLTAVAIGCAGHATPSIRKIGTNFADKLRSVCIVRLRTKATEFSLVYKFPSDHSTLKMETMCSPETSGFLRTVRRYNP